MSNNSDRQLQWVPKPGEIVWHKPTEMGVLVQKRTRVFDAAGEVVEVRLWDSRGDGQPFPLSECSPILDAFRVFKGDRFSIWVDGRKVLARLIYPGDGSIVVSVSRGDRIAHVKIPDISDQVIAAAVQLAQAFDGALIN